MKIARLLAYHVELPLHEATCQSVVATFVVNSGCRKIWIIEL